MKNQLMSFCLCLTSWGLLVPSSLLAQKLDFSQFSEKGKKKFDKASNKASGSGAVSDLKNIFQSGTNPLQQGPIQKFKSNRLFGQCEVTMTANPTRSCPISELQNPSLYGDKKSVALAEAMNSIGENGQRIAALQKELIVSKQRGHKSGPSCYRDRIDDLKGLKSQYLAKLSRTKLSLSNAESKFKKLQQDQKVEESIRWAHGEITGEGLTGQQRERLQNSILNEAKYAGCSNYLNQSQATNGVANGLQGVRTLIEKDLTVEVGSPSSEKHLGELYGKNPAQLTNAIQSVITQVATGVGNDYNGFLENGIDLQNYQDSTGESFHESARLDTEIKAFQRNYAQGFEKYKRQLKTVMGTSTEGENLAEQAFNADNQTFNAKLKLWKDRQYRQCLSDIAGSSSTSFPDFLKKRIVRTNENRSVGVAINNLKADIDSLFQDNIELDFPRIYETLGKYGQTSGIAIRVAKVQDFPSGNLNPADLFREMTKRCTSFFNNKQSNEGVSSVNGAERLAKQIRSKFIQKSSQASADLIKHLSSKMLTCQGGYTPNSSNCSGDKLNITSSQFCLAESRSCFEQVNSCRNNLEQELQKKGAAFKTMVGQYNKRVENHRDNQVSLLRAAVGDLEQSLSRMASEYGFATHGSFAIEGQIDFELFNIAKDGSLGEEPIYPFDVNFTEKMLDNLETVKSSVAKYFEDIIQEGQQELEEEKKRIDADIERITVANQACQQAVAQESERLAESTEKALTGCEHLSKRTIDPCGDVADASAELSVLRLLGVDFKGGYNEVCSESSTSKIEQYLTTDGKHAYDEILSKSESKIEKEDFRQYEDNILYCNEVVKSSSSSTIKDYCEKIKSGNAEGESSDHGTSH